MASSQVNVWGQMLGSTRGGLHWVPGGRADQAAGRSPCQELDDSVILFLLKCCVDHLSVLRQVVGLVLGATSLVSVAYFGDFTGYEFLGGGGCEIAVVCRAV